MSFQVRSQRRPNTVGLDDQVLVLEDGQGAGMEIWPAQGFQWYRWTVGAPGSAAAPVDLLFATAQYFQEGRPTRSGNPILFPFPNRIRAGRFSWRGEDYLLPGNDATGRHAIHGFACRHPFRVLDIVEDADCAWVRAEYQASKDAPATCSLWPADHGLRVTYRFFGSRVRLEVEVYNPADQDLPWGLGFHPYFSLAPFGGEDALVGVPARKFWELAESLPQGTRPAVAGARDLQTGRSCRDLTLDDVLTDLDFSATQDVAGLSVVGWVRGGPDQRRLLVRADASFRELVIFNPAHRQAVCLEPYTCATDAINLQAQGIAAGLRVLSPGQSWQGTIEFVYE